MPTYPKHAAARRSPKASTRNGVRIPSITYLITCVMLLLLVLSPIPISASQPKAADDYHTVEEDSGYSRIDVLANDSPTDGLTIVAVTPAGHGRVDTIEDDTAISYIPDDDFFGSDEFTYRVDDGHGHTDTARVFVTVTGVNDAPTLVNDTAHTNEDAPVTIDVLDNDTDIDGNLDPNTVEHISGPTHGTANVLTDGNIQYVPEPDWNGTDTLTYRACDDGTPTPIECDTAIVHIAIDPVPDPPVADAGENQSVLTLALVTLDGSGSYDPDDPNGDQELIYFWEKTGGPPISNWNNPAAESPTFVAPDDPCTLTFTLQVIDLDSYVSIKDETVVTVNNQTPIADAGSDQRVTTGALVTLDGTGSRDPDHDELDYYWEQIGEQTVSLSSRTVPMPTFTAPTEPTVLQFSLRVNDEYDAATSDQVQITVYEPPIFHVYLPMLSKPFIGPDLVVHSIQATKNNVQLVIKNQGNAPVTDEFYVDVYINPSPIPTQVNQTWLDLADYGMVWLVRDSALAALVPGASITLSYMDPYYDKDYSSFPGSLSPNTPIYAQVDSYNPDTNYGLVLELHEIADKKYNNILGPINSMAALSSYPMAHHPTDPDANTYASNGPLEHLPDHVPPRP